MLCVIWGMVAPCGLPLGVRVLAPVILLRGSQTIAFGVGVGVGVGALASIPCL